jgi:hypothetical protein
MIYAAILACWAERCMSIEDQRGPYATRAECAARLEVMAATAVIAFGHMPGLSLAPMCGPLDEVRRMIPDAYEGEADA